jgi:hypothetical protein
MAGPTVNQQAKPGIPVVSQLVTIQQRMATVIFCQSSLQLHSPIIAKFNHLSHINSMIHTVMDFFVYSLPALVYASKRNQVSASFDAEIDPFHLVTW